LTWGCVIVVIIVIDMGCVVVNMGSVDDNNVGGVLSHVDDVGGASTMCIVHRCVWCVDAYGASTTWALLTWLSSTWAIVDVDVVDTLSLVLACALVLVLVLTLAGAAVVV
jgi:hypothetical protein